MKNLILPLSLSLIFFNLNAQNSYLAKVNQPESLNIPIITNIDVSIVNKILISWTKDENLNTDHYNIYKQNNDKWELIGTNNYFEPTVFTDSITNPLLQSYNYKISAIDKCGNEFLMNNFSNTINLSLYKGLNGAYSLVWDKYLGYSISEYRVYRGFSRENLKLIASVNSSTFNYNDIFVPNGNIYYLVEAVGEIISSHSNIATNVSTKLNEMRSIVKISPNPFNLKTNITFENNKHVLIEVSIFDLNGKKIFSQSTNDNNIEFRKKDLHQGTYIVEIKGDVLLKEKLIIY